MPRFKLQPEHLLGVGELPQVANSRLNNGEKGNLQTVQRMRAVARQRSQHPLIRRLAIKILDYHYIPDHFYLSESKAIGQYVKSKVRYLKDINGVETLIDPLTLIDQITKGEAAGDCDDMSLLIATLLLSIGHQPYFRIIKYRGRFGPYKHIYVVVYEKNPGQRKQRLVLDGILKKYPIGTEVPHNYGKEIAA